MGEEEEQGRWVWVHHTLCTWEEGLLGGVAELGSAPGPGAVHL